MLLTIDDKELAQHLGCLAAEVITLDYASPDADAEIGNAIQRAVEGCLMAERADAEADEEAELDEAEILRVAALRRGADAQRKAEIWQEAERAMEKRLAISFAGAHAAPIEEVERELTSLTSIGHADPRVVKVWATRVLGEEGYRLARSWGEAAAHMVALNHVSPEAAPVIIDQAGRLATPLEHATRLGVFCTIATQRYQETMRTGGAK